MFVFIIFLGLFIFGLIKKRTLFSILSCVFGMLIFTIIFILPGILSLFHLEKFSSFCGYIGSGFFGPDGTSGDCKCWGIEYPRLENCFDCSSHTDCLGIVTERKCYDNNYEVDCKGDVYENVWGFGK